MRRLLNISPTSAAFIAVIFCVPIAVIFPMVILNVKPSLGPLLTGADGYPRHWVPLGALVLLPVALVIASVPIARTRRAGGSLLAHPRNVVVAGLILLSISAFATTFIVDQYPCWIGVPNCD